MPPVYLTGGISKILCALFVLERFFIREKLLLRGAIALGDLYHRNGIVFGPALVEAYLLEHECAIYPRSIIKKNTILEGMKTCHSSFGREGIMRKFRKDNDGCFSMII